MTPLDRRPLPLTAGLEGGLLAGVCALAATLYAGCFSPTNLAPVAGASLVGAVVAWLFAWRGVGTVFSLAWSAAAWLVYLTTTVLSPTLSGGLPRGETWTALRRGVVGGWLRLLTTSAPADPTPTLLVFPVLVTWWCGWAGLVLVHRTRRIVVPVIPSLAAFTVALMFGAPGLERSLGLTAVCAACLLSYLLLRTNRPAPGPAATSPHGQTPFEASRSADQRRAMLGRLVYGAPSLLVVVVLALVAATTALPSDSGADRFDPRSLVSQPFHVEAAITPLATIQSQLSQQPTKALFGVSQTGPPVDRIRLAALDGFDGSTWTAPNDRYLPVGQLLPQSDLMRGGTRAILKVRVITKGESAFLPVIGQPEKLSASGLGYSASGTLAASSPPDAGLSYTLTSTLRPYAELSATSAISRPEPAEEYTDLPTAPAALTEIAGRITQRARTRYEQVTMLAAYLRALPYDPASRPGHSYGAVTRMLAHPEPGDQNAFAEQHAAAFVVLARLLKIPARVAVGYLVDAKALASGQEVVVTTRDAHAWGEVPIEGYGWVAFETVDLTKTAKAVPPSQVVSAPDTGDGTQVATPDAAPGASGGTGGGGCVRAGARTSLVLLWSLLAVMVLYVVAVVGEKRRRGWARRHARAPSEAVVGAWREAADRLTERGVPPRRNWTPDEHAREASRVLGAPAAAGVLLAPVVGHALFAPEQPTTQDTAQAWLLAGQLTRDLDGGRHLGSRLLALLDPRPLLPRNWSPPLRLRRRRR